jgi:pyruvate dehydrogenase E1 component alpha subunit
MTLQAAPISQPHPLVSSVVRCLRDDSTLDPSTDPRLTAEQAVDLYGHMLVNRLLDRRLEQLQRQGRIGFHVGSFGEEGAICGSAFALRETDWIFPCYRELGAALMRGLPLQTFIDNVFGNADDTVRGRQMPDHYTCRAKRFVSISSPVGTQITQAVGFAWAARLRREAICTLVYFGDGATSSTDFHGGMNFAGVFKAPTVFFCRNNGYAISVPSDRQSASQTFAQKADAYGMPGVRVDGNDVFAVIHVVREAIERAARGDGPTLIEALTYRLGAHSTSDDPSRYRDPMEVDAWSQRDPILRLRRHLEHRGLWGAEQEARFEAQLDERYREAVARAEAKPPPPLESLFDDVYAELPWHLKEQREQILTGPRPHTHHG